MEDLKQKMDKIQDKFLDVLLKEDPSTEKCSTVLKNYGAYQSICDKHEDAEFNRYVKSAEVDLEAERNQTELTKVETNATNAKKDRRNKIVTTVLGIAGSIAGIFVAANLSEENVFSREAWSFVQKPRN